jgi:hypothetical protein
VEDFGFEDDWIIYLDCRNIELKLCFREDCWINRGIGTVGESFDWGTISTNMYLFTKIWVIRHYIRLIGIRERGLQFLLYINICSSCHG